MSSSNDADLEVPQVREIFTSRLRLRTAQVTDAEGLFPILAREDVMQWTSRGVISTLDEAEKWMKDKTLGKDVYNFVIESKGCAHAGIMGTFHLPSIGYLLHPDQAGQGYATEALQALVPLLFDAVSMAKDGGFDFLEAVTDPANGGSRRVLEKCGFKLCEIRHQDHTHPIRGVSDTCVYRIARPGHSLEELGLLATARDDEEGKIVPPIR